MFITAKKRFTGHVVLSLSALLCTRLPSFAQNNTVAIEAVKMNVLYIGVDNPIRIVASGVPAEDLVVQLVGAGSIEGANGEYIVHVTQPGEVIVRIQRKGKTGDTFITEQKYRVKRVPDLTPCLNGKYTSGSIAKENLVGSTDIQAMLDNFDFDATCVVVNFTLTTLIKGQSPVTMDCVGGQIPPKATEIFKQMSGDGDAVFFDDIKVKCPGDGAVRHIGGLAFKLKPQ